MAGTCGLGDQPPTVDESDRSDPALTGPPAADRGPRPRGPRRSGSALLRSGAVLGAAEALVAIGAAALSVQLSRSIVVDPLDRVGQVSGVAGLDLRFVLLGLVVVGACLVTGRLARRAGLAAGRPAARAPPSPG